MSLCGGNTKTHIDFLLVYYRDRALVTDVKVVPHETVATHHRPLICTLKFGRRKIEKQARLWTNDDTENFREKEILYYAFLRNETLAYLTGGEESG